MRRLAILFLAWGVVAFSQENVRAGADVDCGPAEQIRALLKEVDSCHGVSQGLDSVFSSCVAPLQRLLKKAAAGAAEDSEDLYGLTSEAIKDFVCVQYYNSSSGQSLYVRTCVTDYTKRVRATFPPACRQKEEQSESRHTAQSFQLREVAVPVASLQAAVASGVNFDNSGSFPAFSGLLASNFTAGSFSSLSLQGPPGSKPPQGPPGSKPPPQGPPGSKPPGGDDKPPSSSPPPSRPTPVFVAPAPPPAWWNTVDEEEILWLDGPFSERDLSWQQGSWDGETRWVTGWYPWPRTFVSVGREAVSEKFIRTPENQDQTFRVNLVSRQTVTVKQCYYRAYYDVEWNSFEGAWVGVGPNGGFRFYRSSCYRSTNYGPREEDLTRQVSVRFASSGKPILPWEQELFRVTFDGRNVGVFPVNTNSGPSYEYQPISNDGYSVVLQPGRKLLNSPFPGGVNLRVEPTSDGRGFRLQVIDWWTDYYDKIPGETLELYVLIEDATGLQRDLFEYSKRNPLRLVTYQQRDIQKSSGEAENPKTLEIRGPWQADWLSPGSKPRRQYNVTWSFRRTGSNISNGSWIDKGRIFVQF